MSLFGILFADAGKRVTEDRGLDPGVSLEEDLTAVLVQAHPEVGAHESDVINL